MSSRNKTKHRHLPKYPEVDALRQGFEAGSQASVLASEDLATALAVEYEEGNSAAYRRGHRVAWTSAFVLGFFAGISTDKVPDKHRKALIEAERVYGSKMRNAGIVVDPR